MATTEPAAVSSSDAADAEALADRIFESTLAAMDLFAVYLGDRLGYYRALATGGPATSAVLADRTGTNERYTREWLEQQAVTGILTVEGTGDATTRRFALPAAYETVLADPDSLLAMAPMAQIFAGCVAPLPAVLDAFRTGGGVPYEDFGPDLAEGQAGTTRPQFRHLLAQEWIPAMPDVLARLQDTANPSRVADVGMGLGWSSIALARAFPAIRVEGFDLDPASVAAATANAAEAGVADRVTFHAQDAAEAGMDGQFDFALAVECIHDMSDPVSVLAAMRRLVGTNGPVLIVDEKVAETFSAPGDEVERYMYGFSILHCLPAGMAEQPSVATGTVMRVETLRRYAEAAGFGSVEVLPIEHDFFRFYRLDA